jgi:hypothetical protein
MKNSKAGMKLNINTGFGINNFISKNDEKLLKKT